MHRVAVAEFQSITVNLKWVLLLLSDRYVDGSAILKISGKGAGTIEIILRVHNGHRPDRILIINYTK